MQALPFSGGFYGPTSLSLSKLIVLVEQDQCNYAFPELIQDIVGGFIVYPPMHIYTKIVLNLDHSRLAKTMARTPPHTETIAALLLSTPALLRTADEPALEAPALEADPVVLALLTSSSSSPWVAPNV